MSDVNYWWVNQNQTYEQERTGGYMWSPQRNANGAYNQFYENMKSVRPGDIIFSYRKTKLVAIGRARSVGREAPKPNEFGEVGRNWALKGWRVEVDYSELDNQVRPKNFIDELKPLLPDKYSPIRANGDGLQNVYLAAVPRGMAELLLEKIGSNRVLLDGALVEDADDERSAVEDIISEEIALQPEISETERLALTKSRRGQGLFRERVLVREPSCRVTGVTDQELLIASHIKPWARCANHHERLDGANGLMLTPTIDRLFDRGLVSFSDAGELLVSTDLSDRTAKLLRLDEFDNPKALGSEQIVYMNYHRREIFRC
jgi:putative restriction endonuclease